jgi:hypothetical protein
VTLTEARRYAVQKKTRIEFRTSQGLVVVVDESGVGRVPELKAAPEFVMTTEFDQAAEFTLVKGALRKNVSRQELTELAGPSKAASHAHDEEE